MGIGVAKGFIGGYIGMYRGVWGLVAFRGFPKLGYVFEDPQNQG